MTRVKICGVTNANDANFAADCGADAIGLNFYAKSVRYLSPQLAAPLIHQLSPFVATVGVFVHTPIRQCTAVAFQLGLRAIQTIDDEPQANDAFPFAYIPAFRIADASQLDAIRTYVAQQRPSAVLIDSHVPGQMGGTGVTAPWQQLAGFAPGVPVILAGGLTPDNVQEAIRTVRPWGVDVASGVESSPGVKDRQKIRDFIAAVRSA